MREIKFRAYIKNEKRWITEVTNMIHSVNGWLVTESKDGFDIAYYYPDEINLMQYTGLKDKSGEGEELYHKDLIVNSSRNGGKPHIVEWSEWYAGWVGVYGGLEYLISTELHEIKKVGNIYENPELHEY